MSVDVFYCGTRKYKHEEHQDLITVQGELVWLYVNTCPVRLDLLLYYIGDFAKDAQFLDRSLC